MNADRQTWFRELEPPPGGAERLRQRLEQVGRPAAAVAPRTVLAGGAAALAIAIALFALLRNDEGADRQAVANLSEAAEFDRLLGRPLERTELNLTVDEQAVPVSRVNTSDPKIRIYEID